MAVNVVNEYAATSDLVLVIFERKVLYSLSVTATNESVLTTNLSNTGKAH